MARNSYLIVSKRLLANNNISLAAKLLFAELEDHRNRKTGQCNPRRELLARELGVSIPTISRALSELQKFGLIHIKQGRYTNFYEFQPDQNDPAEISTAGSKRYGSTDQNDPAAPPASLYEPIPIEPTQAAALSEVQEARAAAAGNTNKKQKQKQKQKQKPPAPATDATAFSVVREWLYALAPLVHLPSPDDALVRAVIAAARGAPAQDITAALVALYKSGALRNMRSWGFILLKIGDCARKATA